MRTKSPVILAVSAMIIIMAVEFVSATPTFEFAPKPKYAREISSIPPGIYAVVYPSEEERPFLMSRKSDNPKIASSYSFLLIIASINLFDDEFGEPFIVEIGVNQLVLENIKNGFLVKDQMIEITEIERRIIYFHPLAKKLEKEYCIYRFISSEGTEKCS